MRAAGSIAFGGRALQADAQAKYLNSPETPLFHKGHVLYNQHRARAAAHQTGTVIAVEGYIDVIALAQAGIENVVAPLGTALTEGQLDLLWRARAGADPLFRRRQGRPARRLPGHRRRVAASEARPLAPLRLPARGARTRTISSAPRAARRCDAVLARARPLVEVLWDARSRPSRSTRPNGVPPLKPPRRSRQEHRRRERAAALHQRHGRAAADLHARRTRAGGLSKARRERGRGRPTGAHAAAFAAEPMRASASLRAKLAVLRSRGRCERRRSYWRWSATRICWTVTPRPCPSSSCVSPNSTGSRIAALDAASHGEAENAEMLATFARPRRAVGRLGAGRGRTSARIVVDRCRRGRSRRRNRFPSQPRLAPEGACAT